MTDLDILEDEEVEQCDTCDAPEDECSCIHCNQCGDKIGDYDLCEVCEDSHSFCCTCCSNCGMTMCECCSECGGYECGCSDGFGHSEQTPWESRGIRTESTAYSSTSNWAVIWPEVDSGNFDLCREAADFYVLEAITNGIVNSLNPFAYLDIIQKANPEQLLVLIGVDDPRIVHDLTNRRDTLVILDDVESPHPLESTLRALVKQAKELYTSKIENADNVLRAYFHMAVAGEARHHRAMKERILSSNREQAWAGWRSIYDQIGPEALLDLANMFMEFEGGSYGGSPWAEACKILYSREMGTLGPNEFLNKKMFIDRAWTLEHNGGCFLNKITWGVANPKGWHMGELKDRVLNAHASDPPQWRTLLKVASEEVIAFWDQIWEINNELNGTDNENPRASMSQTRITCRYCKSNPEYGHMSGCAAHKIPGFNPDFTSPQSWFVIVDEEDWHQHPWHVWEKTQKNAFFDASFQIKDKSVPVEVTITAQINTYAESKSEPYKTLNTYHIANEVIKIPQEEMHTWEIDPNDFLRNLKEGSHKKAMQDMCSMFGFMEENDVRITYLNGQLSWSTPWVHASYLNISDPYNTIHPNFKPVPEHTAQIGS